MKITQSFTFEAAHFLPNVGPKHRCRNMHGHSYRIDVSLEGPVDPVSGFVMDFFDVEVVFDPLLKQLDHHCLNDIDGLENPTVENIAIWLWDRLKPSLPLVSAITVHETPHCWAVYEGEKEL